MKGFSLATYELFLSVSLLILPFMPSEVQPTLAFTVVLVAHLPLRLPQTLIMCQLQRLIRPVTSTREDKPDSLLLFTSLLSYYRSQLEEVDATHEHPELGPLLVVLTGIMAHHSLPSCHVLSSH